MLMRELGQRAGSPSSRAVSYRTGGMVSHTTVADLMSGKRIPRWPALLQIAQALRATPEDLREIRSVWEHHEEGRKARRAAARTLRIREGLVIRPGDTVVITVANAPDEDQESWLQNLADQFPRNEVKVIVGGSIAVIRADHQLEAHLDGLSCDYGDCVQCYPLGRRVALIGHPGAGCTALADATGERCREACCSQLEPPFEGELPL